MKNFCKIAGLILSLACVCQVAAEGVPVVTVFHDVKRFAAWPANEGMWSWGDEILMAFDVADFEERGDRHSLTGEMEVVFARSMDGGKSWKLERHANVVPPARIRGGNGAVKYEGGVDFMAGGFAMKLRGKFFHISKDRGIHWEGPFVIPDFGQRIDARTSYLVTGKESCLFFIPCDVTDARGKRIRSCVAETTDGGKTVNFVSWIGKDPLDEAQPGTQPKGDDVSSTMPSVVKLDDGRLVCALRKRIKSRKWSGIYESGDGGKTWKELSVLERGATNPVALVKAGGKIAAVYGSRKVMPGRICAKLSDDGGKTWGEEVTLRGEGRKWDLGYARATQTPDGEIVVVYYFADEAKPQQHIEALRWKP